MNGELRVVDDVAGAFASMVEREAPPSIALSGGETARRCYGLLARLSTDWSGVDIWFGDERWVPIDDDDSNEGMARRVLLDRAMPRAVHSLRLAGDTPERATAAYDEELRRYDPIALVHLGLGPDGHTASLFPGSPALVERERLVVATGDGQHQHPRLTFTYPALARSRLIVFTVEGEGKRDAFARVRAGDLAAPATTVAAERVVWLVDPAAAGP
ncbi:MAG TPA: 6-phosphogluconolactonase [Acidimicrobiia bacterium]